MNASPSFEHFCEVLAQSNLSTTQYAHTLSIIIDEAYAIEPEQTRKVIACLLSALSANAASCSDSCLARCPPSSVTDLSLNYFLASGAVLAKVSGQPGCLSSFASLLLEISCRPFIHAYDVLVFLFFLMRSCEFGQHLKANTTLHFKDSCDDGPLLAIRFLCNKTVPTCGQLLSRISSSPCLLSPSGYSYYEFDMLCLFSSLLSNYPAECDKLSAIITSGQLNTERKLQFCSRFVASCIENEALTFFLFSPAVVHFFSSLVITNPDQAASFFTALSGLKTGDVSFRLTLFIWTSTYGFDAAISRDPIGCLAPSCGLKEHLVSSPSSIPAFGRLDHGKRVHFLKRLSATFEAYSGTSTHLTNCQYMCVHMMVHFSDNYSHFSDYHSAFYIFLRKVGQSPLTEKAKKAYVEFKQFLHQSTRYVGEERRYNFLKIAELIDNYACCSKDNIALDNALSLLYALAFSVLAEPSEHSSEYGGLIFEFDELLSSSTQQNSCRAFLDLLTSLRARNSVFWRHYTNKVFFDSLTLFDPEEVVQFVCDILENTIQLDDLSSNSDSALEEFSDDGEEILTASTNSSADPLGKSDLVQSEESVDSEELDAIDSRLSAFFSLRKKNVATDKLKKNTALWACMKAFDWLELATADNFQLTLDYKLLIMKHIYNVQLSGAFAQRMKSFVSSRYRFGKSAKSSFPLKTDETGQKAIAHINAFVDKFKKLITIKPYAGHFFAFIIGLASCDDRLAAAKQATITIVTEQWHAYINSTRSRDRLGAFLVELFSNRPLIAKLIVSEAESSNFIQTVRPFKPFEEFRFWKICATIIPALSESQKVRYYFVTQHRATFCTLYQHQPSQAFNNMHSREGIKRKRKGYFCSLSGLLGT